MVGIFVWIYIWQTQSSESESESPESDEDELQEQIKALQEANADLEEEVKLWRERAIQLGWEPTIPHFPATMEYGWD